MGGNGVTNIPGVSGGSGVSDGTGVAGVGGTQTLGLNFLSGAISSLVSFTRATPATVTDFEGLIKTVKSGEVRFDGMRRVENLLTYSQVIGGTNWLNSNITSTLNSDIAPDGSQTATLGTKSVAVDAIINQDFTATAGTFYTASIYVLKTSSVNAFELGLGLIFSGNDASIYCDLNTKTGQTATRFGSASVSVENKERYWRLSIANTVAGTGTLISSFFRIRPTIGTTVGVYDGTATGSAVIWGAQIENVTGQTNQNPSEYIATNVLSYPYQGAGVDGVQYFPYTNPNCVINGAITQIPTVSINSSNSKFTYGTTASGDYFSTPSSAVNQITGDLSLLVQVALDDWTPTTVQTLVAKDGVSAGTRSWAFNIQTSGALRLNYSLDGTNIISVTASASTGFTDGTVHYVGVQREASTGIVRFYTSEDNLTFTLLGTQQTGTSGSLYNASGTAVQFGNLSSLSFALDGKIYDSHVYSGLKFTGTSTMVMDFDPSNWTSGSTFTGLETGEVWTLNGNAKIYQGLWDAQGPKCMLIEEQRTNVFLNSTAPATQSFTTTASPYTISFYGSGSITLSGSYVAVVTGSNAFIRTTLTFTPTALPLVMTVAGTITKPQLEAGSFATSYIETAGSQVTRNADQASMTGTNFSSWYNQSQGSLYCEYKGNANAPTSINQGIVSFGPGGYNAANSMTTFINSGGIVVNYNLSGTASSPVGQTRTIEGKVFSSYSSTTISLTNNGGAVTTSSTSASAGGITSMLIGYTSLGALNGNIRKLSYYPQALPSATLQALTS